MMENLKCCGYCAHGEHVPTTDYTVVCSFSGMTKLVEDEGCHLFKSICDDDCYWDFFYEEENDGERNNTRTIRGIL